MKKILLVCSVLLGINCYSQTAEEQKYLEQAEASINDEVYGAFLKEVVKFRLSDDNLNAMYYSNNLIDQEFRSTLAKAQINAFNKKFRS